jgi:hypothetical protein
MAATANTDAGTGQRATVVGGNAASGKSPITGIVNWIRKMYTSPAPAGGAEEYQSGGQYEVNHMGDPVNPNYPGVGVAQAAAGTVLVGGMAAVAPEVVPVIRIIGNKILRKEEEWSVPQSVRDKFPESWGAGAPNSKGVGQRWQDPKNKGNGVRVDQGNPLNSQPVQQAHIPLSEYMKWETWFSPN